LENKDTAPSMVRKLHGAVEVPAVLDWVVAEALLILEFLGTQTTVHYTKVASTD
jgi:hypothetical protein